MSKQNRKQRLITNLLKKSNQPRFAGSRSRSSDFNNNSNSLPSANRRFKMSPPARTSVPVIETSSPEEPSLPEQPSSGFSYTFPLTLS